MGRRRRLGCRVETPPHVSPYVLSVSAHAPTICKFCRDATKLMAAAAASTASQAVSLVKESSFLPSLLSVDML